MSPEPPPGGAAGSQLPSLRNVIREFGLGARRSLGQHFLLDPNLTGRIARAAGTLTNKTVVEIGPGPGGLTRSLLETDLKKLIVVERDKRCVLALQDLKEFYPEKLEIIEGDALKFQPDSVLATDTKCMIVANLPYNIATPLLIGWLRDRSRIQSMTLMFQKEVADRIVATPGSAAYGRLSVISQWLCETDRLFDIPPTAFVPPPKVTSSLIRIVPKPGMVSTEEFSLLENLTRAAFGQRRKMLRSSLKGFTANPSKLLALAGIQSDRRAETLSIDEFCKIAAEHRNSIRSEIQ